MAEGINETRNKVIGLPWLSQQIGVSCRDGNHLRCALEKDFVISEEFFDQRRQLNE